MKTLLSTALAAAALAASPALAQTGHGGAHQGQPQTGASQPATPPAATSDPSAQGSGETNRAGMTGEQLADSGQRVVEALSRSGMTNIKIMDAAYLVQATTPDDEEVMIIVNSAGQPMSPARVGQSNDTRMRQGGVEAPQDGETGTPTPN